MIDAHDKRFTDQSVKDEWENVYAHHVQLQRTQCQECRKLRDVEQKSGQRKAATPEQNRASRKTHYDAIKQLEEHWEKGNCPDRKEVGAGWLLDSYKPFNPADAVMVEVMFVCRNMYGCNIA